MLLTLLLILLLPFLYLLLSSIWNIVRNYSAARQIGIPIVTLWVSIDNPFWMLFSKYIRPFLNLLPFYSRLFSRFDHLGWEYEQRRTVHRDGEMGLGDAFVMVTPTQNSIYLCDAEAAVDIFHVERQQAGLERPTEMLETLGVFGPCIFTVRSQDWHRHRKCTAASFNERSNRVVWTESLKQARQMLQYWTDADMSKAKGIQTTAVDVRNLALNVMLSVGFGKSYDFHGTVGEAEESPNDTARQDQMSYRDALSTILQNTIPILALGPKLLSRIPWPKKLAYFDQAMIVFKRYMVDLYEEKRLDIQGVKGKRENLLTSLIQVSVNEKIISEEEVFGNMFCFSFAGHDTTAHTLTFTLLMLAAHPEVQEWMAEEIRHVLKDDDDSLHWNFESCGRLNRCLAVLLESLRVYHPVLNVVKTTKAKPAELTVGSRRLTIPPNTRLYMSIHSIQTHPRYWGPDGDEWRPSRWILTANGEGHPIDREYLLTPTHGSYFPWSESRHVCPGKRFTQVEHVAVMAALFREHRVLPVREMGSENDEAARRKVQQIAEDCETRLLLQVRKPEAVGLEWVKSVVKEAAVS